MTLLRSMAPQTRRRKKALAAPQRKRQKKALPAPPPRPAPVIDPADRLSNLPDEIQAHILSFLPAQDAVRTCVLARTWCDVWKQTRRLLITGRKKGVLLKDVPGFVDRLLRLRLDGLKEHRPIDACEISFDFYYYHKNDDVTRAIGRWILRVLKCQVKSLRVDFSRDYDYLIYSIYSKGIPMRDIPLVSQHLTRLELSGLWFFEGSHIDHGCLDLTECPVLEYLEITECEMGNVSEVTSPSVKRLVITDCSGCAYFSLKICCPLVVSLRLEDVNDKSLELESMPELAEAYLSIEDHRHGQVYSDDEEENITKCMVLEGLAVAKHLELLSNHDDVITFTRDLMFCPTFSNLKTLVVNDCWCQSKDSTALACILQHAPVLEKLTVLFSHWVEAESDMVVEGHPDPTGNSTMISQHLKIVELKCSEVDQEVFSYVKYLGQFNIRFEDRETEGYK